MFYDQRSSSLPPRVEMTELTQTNILSGNFALWCYAVQCYILWWQRSKKLDFVLDGCFVYVYVCCLVYGNVTLQRYNDNRNVMLCNVISYCSRFFGGREVRFETL